MKPTRALFDRWSWLLYPAACGGILGWVAGKHPRDPDLFAVISARNFALLINVLSLAVALVVALSVLAFLLGVASGEHGVLARLTNGLGCAFSAGLFILVFLGGGVALCVGLALLGVWTAKGAGPCRGALLGATSVVAAIGLNVGCLAYLGRPLGRFMMKKQREVLAGIEEEIR